ncbi:MAG: endolytic transglycosylase MltG [Candidatus Gracilibacteria bacterium]
MKKFIIIILVFTLLGVGWYTYKEQEYKKHITEKPIAGSTLVKEFTVSSGSSVKKIAHDLFVQELVVNEDSFSRYAAEQNKDKDIAAGTFYITPSLTIPEVLKILTGEVVPTRVRITIPEGYSVNDIGAVLIKKGLVTKAEFDECIKGGCDFKSDFSFLPDNDSLEGYLFPDTYFFDQTKFTLKSFLGLMLQNFEDRVVSGIKKDIEASKYSLDEIIKMASILEKESTPRDDQEIVSGILWKRLENGVQLAADATTRYIKNDPLAPLTYKELQSDNPYNSRRVKGLPPTPISNPGMLSIQAALNPKDSAYWYYLHDNDGIIHFSRTEAEHNKAKALYLE